MEKRIIVAGLIIGAIMAYPAWGALSRIHEGAATGLDLSIALGCIVPPLVSAILALVLVVEARRAT